MSILLPFIEFPKCQKCARNFLVCHLKLLSIQYALCSSAKLHILLRNIHHLKILH